jgi:hypothetical protein
MPSLSTGAFRTFALFLSAASILLPSVGSQAADEPNDVARLFADAAACIYYPYFDAPTIEEGFDSNELEVLARFTTQLNSMIRDALGRGDSICGAYFTEFFRLEQNLDLLRAQVLTPDRFYGWEGEYGSGDSPEFSDDQYVYDSKYIRVIESLTGGPIESFMTLSSREKSQLLIIANDPSHESHEWALWILRKLNVS